MARTSKKARAVAVATAEEVMGVDVRSIGEAAADEVAALPASEPNAVSAEAETVANAANVAVGTTNAADEATTAVAAEEVALR